MEIKRLRVLVIEIFITINNLNPKYIKDIFTPKLHAKLRPNDIPHWFYFGRDFPDYNRTKIGSIKILTYFGSTIADIRKNKRNSMKTHFIDYD